METAQERYTITIKQIVRFQERMDPEKFRLDLEYLVNRARWLDHYYKTKCKVSGEDAPLKFLTLSNSKWPTIGHLSLAHCRY